MHFPLFTVVQCAERRNSPYIFISANPMKREYELVIQALRIQAIKERDAIFYWGSEEPEEGDEILIVAYVSIMTSCVGLLVSQRSSGWLVE
jgi:hypothetical protein